MENYTTSKTGRTKLSVRSVKSFYRKGDSALRSLFRKLIAFLNKKLILKL